MPTILELLAGRDFPTSRRARDPIAEDLAGTYRMVSDWFRPKTALDLLPAEPTRVDERGQRTSRGFFDALRAIENLEPYGPRQKMENPNEWRYAAIPDIYRKWFKGSKIVDEAGEPLRMYHGTGRDFDRFSAAAPHETLGGFRSHGFHVTPDPKVASRYATDFNPMGGNVREMFVSAKKPLRLKAKEYDRLQSIAGKVDEGVPLSEFEQIDLEDLMAKVGPGWKGEHPIKWIQEKGWDAVVRPAKGMSEPEMLLFDPDQVRNAIGFKK